MITWLVYCSVYFKSTIALDSVGNSSHKEEVQLEFAETTRHLSTNNSTSNVDKACYKTKTLIKDDDKRLGYVAISSVPKNRYNPVNNMYSVRNCVAVLDAATAVQVFGDPALPAKIKKIGTGVVTHWQNKGKQANTNDINTFNSKVDLIPLQKKMNEIESRAYILRLTTSDYNIPPNTQLCNVHDHVLIHLRYFSTQYKKSKCSPLSFPASDDSLTNARLYPNAQGFYLPVKLFSSLVETRGWQLFFEQLCKTLVDKNYVENANEDLGILDGIFTMEEVELIRQGKLREFSTARMGIDEYPDDFQTQRMPPM